MGSTFSKELLRDIGAYVGLTPRRDQSGASDPQLPISKCRDTYLRRLLVSAAHYILGPFGPQSALRAYGLIRAGGPILEIPITTALLTCLSTHLE
jgi:hypothetical protein